ncbi:MAG: site-specific integrase [Candidatus Rokubacteria bacterium]|nr:site-specific integrase [Candidatus Rokubacteria bacterium]
MAVKVRQRDGAWWLFIDHQGKRKAKRVGVGKPGKRSAEQAAIQIQAKLAEGDLSALEAPERRAVPTFEQYAERWLTEAIRPHRKTRTEEYYRQIVANHLKPTFGQLRLDGIAPSHVRAFIAEKLGGRGCSKHDVPARDCETCVAPLARNTVKNAAATLRAVLYQAQVDSLIVSNPAARFGRMFDARHDAREHVVVLEPESVASVLTAATKWYPDHELAVRVLFYTGMREGELLGLEWEDIDWRRNLIDLRRTVAFRSHRFIVNTPKSGKLRTVDAPGSLIAALRDRYSIRQAEAAVAGVAVSPWVFPSATDAAKPLNDAWLRDRVWRPLLDKAGVRHVRVHDARHTYASLMLRRGVPIAYVAKQLGHSSIAVTVDLYGHFVPGADRHHVEGLADAIETAGTQPDATQAQPRPAAEQTTRV